MDDLDHDDVILWLLPHKGEGFDGAAFATSMPQNQSRFVAARHDELKQRDIPREERGGTELPVDYGLLKNTDCLAVRFSHGARTSVGVVGGCAANAELSFQDIPGISKYHFAITFDDQSRPIARDLGSKGGTKVTYNEEKGERLSNFDWPLEGPSIANGKPPILNLTDLVQFKGEEIPPRQGRSREPVRLPHYPERSRQQTPSTGSHSRPILYRKQIGNGTYGVVMYVWNLTTREEYVVKQPLAKFIKSRTFSKMMWEKEAEIMRSISHDHIVAFRDATFSPYPKLEFEYVPGGSLDSYTDLSTFECTQLLYQLSSALDHLHNRNPSIGHRDIKPENILVKRRGADGIYVKFADFGLSKAADILKTCCGTLLWAAPEIYLKIADPAGAKEDTYSVAVDIWSLGLVVASRKCGLPEYKQEWMTDAVAWIREVQHHVNDHYLEHGGELLYLIIDNMLVEDPDQRSSADYVNTEALKIMQSMANEPNDEGTATPAPSILGAQSVVELEGLDENSQSADVVDREEVRKRADAPSPETRLGQVLETTEALPQGSTVDGLLWISGGPERASLASGSGSEATIELGTVKARTEDPHEEECNFLGNEGAREAVGLPEGHSPSSLPRSFNYRPSADQQRAISQGPSGHKRSRVSKDLSAGAKATP